MLEILDPRASVGVRKGAAAAPRVSTLEGVPVAIIDDSKPRFDVFVDALFDELADRYGAVGGLRYVKPNAGNFSPDEWYEAIREQGGVAIVGWGDCGGCSTHSFLDAGELVRRGVPAVAVISEAFTSLVALLAKRHALEHVPVLVLPHPPTELDDRELTALARGRAEEVARMLAHEIIASSKSQAARSKVGAV